ncbi:hypothetical protein ACFSMW_14775 [Virgibacillus halophilus]|uniref:Fur-regulated basic protein A n=1 Tax=Tigheibacillus halophilus TaxID=361280 RepID=A0ABU5CBV3_9BACI|nr:hypothetical protein [Virgibacillus halophilus]
MRVYEAQEHIMINHIKEQLNQLGYVDTENKSKRELTHKLAVLRATVVKVGNPANKWF